MPKFVIERQYLLPIYQRLIIDAPDVKTACDKAVEDDDWESAEEERRLRRHDDQRRSRDPGRAHRANRARRHSAQAASSGKTRPDVGRVSTFPNNTNDPSPLRSPRNHDETDGRRQCVPLGSSGNRADGPLSAGSRPRFFAGERSNQTLRRAGSPRVGGASRPIRTGAMAAVGGHLLASAPGGSRRAMGNRVRQAELSETAAGPRSAAPPIRRPGGSLVRPATAAPAAPMLKDLVRGTRSDRAFR